MDNVLIITGASRGIGAATARVAAAAGYSVCVNYRQNREAAERVVAEIEAAGGRAVAVAADVAVEADVVRLFETCDKALGPVDGARQQRRHPRDPDARRRDGRGAAPSRLRDQRGRRVPVRARGGAADVHQARRRGRRDRQRVVGRRPAGLAGEYVDYAASKGAHRHADDRPRARGGRGRHPRQRGARRASSTPRSTRAAASRTASIASRSSCR